MKRAVFAVLIAVVLAAGAFAQSSLFNRYDVNMNQWAKLPTGTTWSGETSWVAADGKGQVVVFVRKAPYFRVFDRDGQFLKAWGDENLLVEAHMMTFDRDGNIWAVDTNGHEVLKLDPNGKVLMILGKRGVAGDNSSHETFNRPATVFLAQNGDIFVSDGYLNSRVVQFTNDGKFIRIIGGIKGSEPGQLKLPHGVVVDSKGRVIVSDSDNKRLSLFDKNGQFLETWAVPCRGGIEILPDDTIYVSDVNAGAVTIMKEGKILDVIHVEGRPHGLGVDRRTLDVYTSSSVAMSPNVTKSSPKKTQ
ncbi:MAG: hypothetical protein C5B51_08885 [Terriglobia bacterium]|nr:MAG: hypothetical protein C5B51_08885 [Terriglobia bacterium]